jgi:hypothetical protein
MSNDSPCTGYTLIPILTKEKFMKWEIQVQAYLTGAANHVHVIRRPKGSDGKFSDPTPPTDLEELLTWNKSERVAMGIIMATASDLHLELIHKMSEEPAWKLWKAIEAQHQQHDASLHHEAWIQLFTTHKKATETYVDFYQQVEAAHQKIDCVTPTDLMPTQRSKELGLFTIINGLDIDNPLCLQLISQKDVTLGNAYSSFLHTDRGKAIKMEAIKSAHAALGRNCFLCRLADHFAKDCLHRDAIASLVTRRNGSSDSRGRRGRGRGNSFGSGNTHVNAASSASSSGTNANSTTNDSSTAKKSTTQETAGVASAFLSRDSHTADVWLCDSGASSSMSSNQSTFLSLKPD